MNQYTDSIIAGLVVKCVYSQFKSLPYEGRISKVGDTVRGLQGQLFCLDRKASVFFDRGAVTDDPRLLCIDLGEQLVKKINPQGVKTKNFIGSVIGVVDDPSSFKSELIFAYRIESDFEQSKQRLRRTRMNQRQMMYA